MPNQDLRVSIDSLREGVQLIDAEWRYVYLNAAAAAHGQRTAADLIGRTMTACYPGIDRTPVFDVLARVMRTRRGERLTHEFTYPAGECRTFDLVVDPVPVGICVLSLDVTERERRRAEVRQLEQALHRERIQVFRATMTTVNDIVNNFLNSLQFVRLEAGDGRLSAEMLDTFDQLIGDTAGKLKRLGELRQVQEKELAIGVGIDFDDAARGGVERATGIEPV